MLSEHDVYTTLATRLLSPEERGGTEKPRLDCLDKRKPYINNTMIPRESFHFEISVPRLSPQEKALYRRIPGQGKGGDGPKYAYVAPYQDYNKSFLFCRSHSVKEEPPIKEEEPDVDLLENPAVRIKAEYEARGFKVSSPSSRPRRRSVPACVRHPKLRRRLSFCPESRSRAVFKLPDALRWRSKQIVTSQRSASRENSWSGSLAEAPVPQPVGQESRGTI